MSRLLVLTPNPITAAATRFRLVAYFDALRAAGIEPELRAFLDEDGFATLYRPGGLGRKLELAAGALIGRAVDLVRAARADAVLIHREAALIGPPVIEWLIARALDRPVIFDFDDAIWVPYASPTYGAALSRLLKAPGKTRFTVGAARCVLAGNPYLAAWASQLSSRVETIPSVVDTDVFVPARPHNPVPVLGWIGTHSTLQYLRTIGPALQRVAARRRFVLRLVGGSIELPGVEIDARPWRLDCEVADFQGLDVGLYPLVEDPWSLGKSAFKAIEYMACGVPVVASPVGFTNDVVRHGVTGYLAATEDEWTVHLDHLLDDADLRIRLGNAGRADAVEKWSLSVYAPRVVDVVRSVCA